MSRRSQGNGGKELKERGRVAGEELRTGIGGVKEVEGGGGEKERRKQTVH